jgi:hypothetical protein
MTLSPNTPPTTVRDAATTKPISKARFRSTPPTRAKTVPVAKVAREIKIVSQPTNIKYESAPGNLLPFTPKDARDKTMVGAFERFPASELTPTNKKDPIVPTKAAIVACQKEIPKPRKKAPYDNASNETFAPAHGQNNDRARPVRSESAITFAPFISSSKAGMLNFSVG